MKERKLLQRLAIISRLREEIWSTCKVNIQLALVNRIILQSTFILTIFNIKKTYKRLIIAYINHTPNVKNIIETLDYSSKLAITSKLILCFCLFFYNYHKNDYNFRNYFLIPNTPFQMFKRLYVFFSKKVKLTVGLKNDIC